MTQQEFTSEETATAITVGAAQRPGTDSEESEKAGLGSVCADGYDVQHRGPEVSAAVVDGAGHHLDTVRYSTTVPTTITQLGMVLGGVTALTTAGRMAEAYSHVPHASAVYANAAPGRPTAIHWIGDCRAYGWRDGDGLTQWSTDQTMGQWLRVNGGVPAEIAARHDNWSRLGLRQACATTCRQVEIPEDTPLVLLCSDGISDQVDQEVAEELCRKHRDSPQALADALVAAATQDEDGYRDDATVVILLRHTN
ncbi:hypothetical protein OG321_42165 [Streptomyces sp. NBC_00424]|uniref:hypothetical protein n=1 Tax=Streptomyces sp. NBC_00424 TaxID=2903648 RepID=UPI00225803EC|nr:hypothetical protein [Streptomyces sp. NBC_00424]MCX5079004.1 hypothetical protein [Streptomyces sp. NBC_00424]